MGCVRCATRALLLAGWWLDLEWGLLAFLYNMRRPLWDYCKQRFAQVTNPPIDPLREAHVMSLDTRIGSFTTDSPVLNGQQMKALEDTCTNTQHIDVTFNSTAGIPGA